jgi:hypothetical protein
LSASDVFDKLRKTSWNFGIKLTKSAGSVTSLLFSLEKILRLEWFIKGFIEVGTSKRLFDSERNSRDMRLVRGPEAIFPVNWLLETSIVVEKTSFPNNLGVNLLNYFQRDLSASDSSIHTNLYNLSRKSQNSVGKIFC